MTKVVILVGMIPTTREIFRVLPLFLAVNAKMFFFGCWREPGGDRLAWEF